MTIFSIYALPLTTDVICVTIRKDDMPIGGIYARNARKILDAQRDSRTFQAIRGSYQEVHPTRQTQSRQARNKFASLGDCLTGVYRQPEQVASQETQNVESLLSNSFPDHLDNRPRFSVQVNQPVRTTPLCKHTAQNGIAQRKRMSLQVVWCAVGGKCVAL